MATQSNFSKAMTNRSLRTIRTELEFLADASAITPQQLSSILSQLPEDIQLNNNTRNIAPVAQPQPQVQPSPVPVQPPVAAYSPPTNQFANTSLNEKAPTPSQYPSPAPPPPAYAQTPPVLSTASALYAYTPTDAGDLALQPHDRIQVLEHMNNDWWRGRNERTGLEGIFPRSYVSVINEKAGPPVIAPQPTNYGNMPLEVSQSGSPAPGPDGKKPNKFEENGKKFGKKMGNAAIFGAGATIGSNIVNGIF
ncbi:SH3 domain protein [Paecilomyces variotii No. 5]|uniref:SH3 domain protein n=1 Tax=Byssochlamys spectabilis (strain No. 5 / NBRC 109023) TaxID=1356009 RepID=V5G8H2_BYSSN|nr:SH3 domain protein [Paecilomyces variotii No. 5]